ncbi:MAG: response regulator [Bacillota bacterium]
MDAWKLLVVDDHPLIREGLCKILNLEPEFQIVGEATNGEEAVRLAFEALPDVILMDINLPVKNGIDACREITDALPQIRVIVLTVYDDERYVSEVFKAGASGYLLKDVEPDRLIEAIKTVAGGGSFIHPTIARKMLKEFNRLSRAVEESKENPLSPRETEVLNLIARGETNRTIAQNLYISEKTVKNHITNIFRKLQVDDRTAAVVLAIKSKILDT